MTPPPSAARPCIWKDCPTCNGKHYGFVGEPHACPTCAEFHRAVDAARAEGVAEEREACVKEACEFCQRGIAFYPGDDRFHNAGVGKAYPARCRAAAIRARNLVTITPLVRRKGSDEMSESLKRTKEAVRRLERDSRPKPGDGDLLVGRRKGRSK